MKKNVLAWAVACIAATAAHATHFPPATKHAVKRIVHDAGKLYILHYDGLEVLDKSSGAITSFHQGDGFFPSPTLNAIAVHNDTIWTGSGYGDLTAICGSQSQSWKVTYNLGEHEENEEIPSWLGFNDMKFDSKGRLYFGGDNCVGFMTAPGEFSCATFPGGLSFGTEIWRMAVDADDRAWMTATCAFMVSCLMSYSPETGFTNGDINEEANFYMQHTKALAIGADGSKWLGCTSKDPYAPALCRLDGNGTETYPFTQLKGKHSVTDMAFDSRGRIWFLPDIEYNKEDVGFQEYSKGPLCCYDNGTLTEYPYSEASMGYSYCLDVDGGTVYIGTDSGVLKFENGQFSFLNSNWSNNPTDIQKAVSTNESRSATYDLQGRVRNNQKRGVYIQEGRKSLK